jgi:NADPH:quinone reductase-like Zn-dependent oxidoreductase
MKAIVSTEYGSPDVMQLKEIDRPAPQADEVLVKVHAAGANAADWHLLRGAPLFARLETGFPKPKHTILGADVAGRVEAVGRNVTRFQPGDEVFGDTFQCGWGGFAEYVRVHQERLAAKPPQLTFEEAAAVPLAAFTALQGLRDAGQIQAGQQVLINGASGGVGSFAVQMAKTFGAEVTAVSSTRNLDLVRSIGADHAIDYTQADFTRNGHRYDLILDAVGNHSVADYRRALRPQGRAVIVGYTTLARLLEHSLIGPRASRAGGQSIGLMGTVRPNSQDLAVVRELLAAGQVVPVIDRRFPLSQTAEAIRYLETGRARGKVVITVTNGHGPAPAENRP